MSDTSPNALAPSGIVVSSSFSRRADTLAYTAGDVVSDSNTVSTLMKFAQAARALGRSGYITRANLETNGPAWNSVMRLWLYTKPAGVAPLVVVPVDNAAMKTLFANDPLSIGYIDFPACAHEADATSDGAHALAAPLNLGYACDPGDDAIYGLLVDTTGVAPLSGQTFSVKLLVDRY